MRAHRLVTGRVRQLLSLDDSSAGHQRETLTAIKKAYNFWVSLA